MKDDTDLLIEEMYNHEIERRKPEIEDAKEKLESTEAEFKRLAVCRTWVSGLFLQTIIQARSSRQGALAHKINIYMYSMGVLNPQQAPVTARQMPFCPVSGPLQVV